MEPSDEHPMAALALDARRIWLPGGASLRGVTSRVARLLCPLPIPANCWLVCERDGLTLVDAGYRGSAGAILAAAERLGRPIRRLVVTHAHPDHAGATAVVAARAGAEVLAHPDEIPFLVGEASLAEVPGDWLCCQVLRLARRLGVLDPLPTSQVSAVKDGDEVGGLRVLHTPGHTPGSISLWDPVDGALYFGDNVTVQLGIPHLGVPWFTLDRKRRDREVARCADLPARWMLAGHGPVYRGDVGRMLHKVGKSRDEK